MKKYPLSKSPRTCVHACFLAMFILLSYSAAEAQSCPASSTPTINAYTDINTYYPGTTATVAAGTKTIVLGNSSGLGTTPISVGDVVLIIQMQGAQITSTNGVTYGDGTGTGGGYMNNANLLAGQMEYGIAASAVPLIGGTLTLVSNVTNSYKNANFGTDGQYRYQVIRVPIFYNAMLGTTITPPAWNGSAGGVIDLYVWHALNMNGQTIDASSMGFRGGGGKNYSGGSSGTFNDYVAIAPTAVSTAQAGGSKGEGIAGTPKNLYSLGSGTLISTGVEGYPGGSYDRGAPGNAGGGATDGDPSSNSNNAGGGGGGNGGTGGVGGKSWNSARIVGGIGGAVFAQRSPSRLVMGGGGGAGSTDGGTGSPGAGYASSGAPGGGIVIVSAGTITGTGSILANGAPPNGSLLNDGSGGGGAGGSVLIVTTATAAGLTVNANGSDGASNTGNGAKHGPGGGGGGGIVYSTNTLSAATANAGFAGVTAGASTFGAGNGVTGFTSQTILATQTPAFPVNCTLLATEFLSATAVSTDENITINWEVSTEENVLGYNVERSFDGVNFSVIGTVTPRVSGSNINDYSYTDSPAGDGSGEVYYRIRQMGIDGTWLFSNTLRLKQSARILKLTVMPNPVAESATLNFMSDRNTGVSIRLIDISGNPVWNKQYQASAGINTVQVDNLQKLPNGLYILQLYNGKNYEKVKMFIRH